MPLHRIAAPSPSVLSFLRRALEPIAAPCAALKGQRCGYGVGNVGSIHTRRSGENTRSGATASCRGFATQQNGQKLRAMQLDRSLSSKQHLSINVPVTPNNSVSHGRTFSTTSFSRGWHLFGHKKSNQRSLPPPPALSDVTGDAPIPLGFENLGRMTRAANEQRMRCTELDEQGNVTMVSGEFKKSELIAKVYPDAATQPKYRANVMSVWSSPS